MQAQIALPNSRALAALVAVVFATIVVFATLVAVRTASVPTRTAPAVQTQTPAVQPFVQAASGENADSQLPVCRRAGGPRC